MGSRNAVKHQVWSSRWESHLESLIKDLRFGVRGLTKTPGFTFVRLLSLALGIGANTSIFTLLNAVIFRPLPVPQPQQLYLFGKGAWVGSMDGMPSRSWQLFSNPFFKDFAEQTPSFSGVAAQSISRWAATFRWDGGAIEHVRIDLVSGSYFNVLGVSPAMGRLIGESDDRHRGASPIAVASYGWFQRHFQGNAAAIGQAVHIQGHDYTIVGVAQPGFTGPRRLHLRISGFPLSMEKEISPGWNGVSDYKFQSLYLIGRLKPGVSLAEAYASTNRPFPPDHPQPVPGRPPVRLRPRKHSSTPASNSFPQPEAFPDCDPQFAAPLTILMGSWALCS